MLPDNQWNPMSPYIAGVGVCFLTPGVDLINFKCIFFQIINAITGIP